MQHEHAQEHDLLLLLGLFYFYISEVTVFVLDKWFFSENFVLQNISWYDIQLTNPAISARKKLLLCDDITNITSLSTSNMIDIISK